ncbi:uncharacterized protein LOC121241443 [Juglans microcarpa x Juglans regia]|uniref:uncharacterized protein LOC121241443 n=1 Tax=Juglans microcarpa x Juglans regia TaxID=2249226 RepID=UPI001B7F0AAD|nr:uncharacterized protein LOC121241443 [Juglans microcarpa x Juglans regia]
MAACVNQNPAFWISSKIRLPPSLPRTLCSPRAISNPSSFRFPYSSNLLFISQIFFPFLILRFLFLPLTSPYPISLPKINLTLTHLCDAEEDSRSSDPPNGAIRDLECRHQLLQHHCLIVHRVTSQCAVVGIKLYLEYQILEEIRDNLSLGVHSTTKTGYHSATFSSSLIVVNTKSKPL